MVHKDKIFHLIQIVLPMRSKVEFGDPTACSPADSESRRDK